MSFPRLVDVKKTSEIIIFAHKLTSQTNKLRRFKYTGFTPDVQSTMDSSTVTCP